jgi:hypothetical protein
MESRFISFVTWPDGSVSGESLTVGNSSQSIARHKHIKSWMPRDWFGDVRGYALDLLWEGMAQKGFKSHTIEIGADGVPVLNKETNSPSKSQRRSIDE